MNKCTGIMGRIFGHKLEKINFLTFNFGSMGKRVIPVFAASDVKIIDSQIEFLMPGDFYCQRCGAVTGEKK